MLRLQLYAAVMAIGFAGCGEDEGGGYDQPGAEVAVVDHADALTASGYDNLFIMTLSRSPGSYAIGYLEVRATRLDNGGKVVVGTQHDDSNGDGLLDPGESLTAQEPIVNFWDDTTVGQGVTVQLDFDDGGGVRRLAGTVWTPAN